MARRREIRRPSYSNECKNTRYTHNTVEGITHLGAGKNDVWNSCQNRQIDPTALRGRQWRRRGQEVTAGQQRHPLSLTTPCHNERRRRRLYIHLRASYQENMRRVNTPAATLPPPHQLLLLLQCRWCRSADDVVKLRDSAIYINLIPADPTGGRRTVLIINPLIRVNLSSGAHKSHSSLAKVGAVLSYDDLLTIGYV